MTSVLSLEQVRAGDTAIAGGKGANLGELAAHGFPVPPGFVVSTQAYREFVESLGLEHEWRESPLSASLPAWRRRWR